jgi:hypothetical protein
MKAEEKIDKLNKLRAEKEKLVKFEWLVSCGAKDGETRGFFIQEKRTLSFLSLDILKKENRIEIPLHITKKILTETKHWIQKIDEQINDLLCKD